MAKLLHLQTGRAWGLRESSQLGRLPTCWIPLSAPCVSGLHAQIIYTGGLWRILDLQSRNGTRLDGEAVGASPRPILRGQRLVLGGREGAAFELVDVAAPEPIAVATHAFTQRIAGEDGVLSLPDGAGSVIVREDGLRWWIDRGAGAPEPAAPGQVVDAGGVRWSLVLPSQHAETIKAGAITPPTLVIQHSQDLDDFELGMRTAGGVLISLGTRTYGLMLYMLAQRLLADRALPHCAQAEAGWTPVADVLDQLTRATGAEVERKHLNLYVTRFRKVMARFTTSDDEGPRIERRKGSDRVRLAGPVVIEALGAR